MKGIKIHKTYTDILDKQPQILVIGKAGKPTQNIFNKLLSDQQLYSKKFGRILYYGYKKYQSDEIVIDEMNYSKQFIYQQVMDQLDDAIKQDIVNILLVVNLQASKTTLQAIQKIMAIRMTYLPGIISFMLKIQKATDIKKQLFLGFNTYFVTQSQQLQKIAPVLGIKSAKKKSNQTFLISSNRLLVIQLN